MTDAVSDRAELPLFCLLLHENEPLRPSGTATLIQTLLPETKTFIWKRTEVAPELLQLLQDQHYEPYLIFPADRPATLARKVKSVKGEKRPLFVIPDGTWKEVRKIVRKSSYLDQLPILNLAPEQTTRYKLRRNPDSDHLCTSEIASLLLQPYSVPLALQLDMNLQQFQQDYYIQRKVDQGLID